MSERYVDRHTSVYTLTNLPFNFTHSNVLIAAPSTIRLKFEHRVNPVDIGCMAYTGRLRSKGNNNIAENSKVKVDTSTLRQARIPRISGLLEDFYTSFKTGKLREQSIFNNIKLFFYFLDWCDNQGFYEAIDTPDASKIFAQKYIDELKHRARASSLHINSAVTIQNNTLQVLAKMFGINMKDISSGLRLLTFNTKAINTTSKPDTGGVQQVLALCNDLFHGITPFILEGSLYPFQLPLLDHTHWIFPTRRWLATPAQLKERASWGKGSWAWNYREGRINNLEEILPFMEAPLASNSLQSAKLCLETANSNLRSESRINLAMWAHDAFSVLFFANTGMNYASVRELVWSDNFIIEKEHQGFRSIKYRARGKTVEFYISDKFLRTFKQYLELRKYLLDKSDFDCLFLSLGQNNSSEPRMINDNITGAFVTKVKKKLGLDIPSISSRQWRVFKADYLIKNTDISTTAMMLQNSDITTIRSYSEGNESESAEDLTSFFNVVRSKLEILSTKGDVASPVGHCTNPNRPSTKRIDSIITPDCHQPEGCLFCENYAVHADAEDIRKLVSLMFVLQETKSMATSIEHFKIVFGQVIQRIELILKAISEKSKQHEELVLSVSSDVYDNENLDPYWEAKLNNLVEIGAV